MLSEVSQTETNTNDVAYMQNLENKTNEQTTQTQPHRHREHVAGCQMGGVLGRWLKKVKGLRSTNCQL